MARRTGRRRWIPWAPLLALVLGGCDLVSGVNDFTTASAVGGSAATGPVACTSITDDFDDGSFEPTLWWPQSAGNALVYEADGNVVLETPSGGAASMASVSSREPQLVDGCAMIVELVEASSQGQYEELLFALALDTDNALAFRIGANITGAGYSLLGDITPSWTAPYDPLGQRWLAIQIDGTLVTWLVSADGQAWDAVSTADVLFADRALSVSMRLTAALGGNPSDGGTSRFDNFNLPPR